MIAAAPLVAQRSLFVPHEILVRVLVGSKSRASPTDDRRKRQTFTSPRQRRGNSHLRLDDLLLS
jgi:hypothetical protein